MAAVRLKRFNLDAAPSFAFAYAEVITAYVEFQRIAQGRSSQELDVHARR